MSQRKKTYIDPEGRELPAKYFSAYDRKRDDVARKIYALYEAEEQRLIALRIHVEKMIEEVRQAAADDADVKLGGDKGYLQFRSIDNNVVIRFENVAKVDFDERLSLAQHLIKEAIEDLKQKAKATSDKSVYQAVEELAKLAEAAFKPRGKNGKLDRQRVRDIAEVKVEHPKWKQAAELIRECETVVGHKAYVRVSKRLTPTAEPIPVILDITKV